MFDPKRKDIPIEITPEMVEAGARVLVDSGYLETMGIVETDGAIRLLVKDIMEAALMSEASVGMHEGGSSLSPEVLLVWALWFPS